MEMARDTEPRKSYPVVSRNSRISCSGEGYSTESGGGTVSNSFYNCNWINITKS